jgi:hypothetical protein
VAFGVVAFVAALALLGSCGDDDGEGGNGAEMPLVGEIAPAVAALEGELGGAVRYYEIRADSLAVTLWVSAREGRWAVPYVFADGELSDPQPAQPVDGGFAFAADDALQFDADHVLDQVADDLADSTLTQFWIEGGEGGATRLNVTAESARGGVLEIVLSPDGEPLEAAES